MQVKSLKRLFRASMFYLNDAFKLFLCFLGQIRTQQRDGQDYVLVVWHCTLHENKKAEIFQSRLFLKTNKFYQRKCAKALFACAIL